MIQARCDMVGKTISFDGVSKRIVAYDSQYRRSPATQVIGECFLLVDADVRRTPPYGQWEAVLCEEVEDLTNSGEIDDEIN